MGAMALQAAGTAGAKALSREYVNWTKYSEEEAHALEHEGEVGYRQQSALPPTVL